MIDDLDANYLAEQVRTNAAILAARAKMSAAREKLHKACVEALQEPREPRKVEIPVPPLDRSTAYPARVSGITPLPVLPKAAQALPRLDAVAAADDRG